jgi:hypothetical protein
LNRLLGFSLKFFTKNYNRNTLFIQQERKMPRIDDFKQALELVKGRLSRVDPKRAAGRIGADFQTDDTGRPSIRIEFLGKQVVVNWPLLEPVFEATGASLPIQQQILLLHYLEGAVSGPGVKPAGEWISYQEVPDGRFYLDAFIRRAKKPLIEAFGQQPDRLIPLAKALYGAIPFDQGDVSILIKAIPMIPVALIMWRGDEEFPPDGNILFDRTVSGFLSAEDIAWLAGMIVYPLVGMVKKA